MCNYNLKLLAIVMILFVFNCSKEKSVAVEDINLNNKTNTSNVIRIVADLWEPYSSTEKTGKPGYVIEILQVILDRSGIESDYMVVPFTRGIEGVKAGTYDILAGLYIDDAPGLIFPKKTIGISVNKCFVKKGDKWKYVKGPNSMNGRILGVIQDYTYAELDEYVEKNKDNSNVVQIMTGADPLVSNLKKLIAGRINVTAEDEQVVKSTLSLLGKEYSNSIQEAGIVGDPYPVYVAFSPAPEKKELTIKLSSIFDNGIVEMRKSGELKKILDTYGLKDWE